MDVETFTDVVFQFIREHNIRVCDDVMSDEDFVLGVNSLTVKAEQTRWQHGKLEFSGTLLRTSTKALSLSTTLSGFERYHTKIHPKKPSPKDLWENDTILRAAIHDNLTRLLDEGSLNRNRLRVHLLMGNGCAYATSFPISFVTWILRREADLVGAPITFLDPCAGWGDRLAGALLVGTSVCSLYVGIDPWWKSMSVCKKIEAKLGGGCKVELLNASCVAEGVEWPATDLCFTSPPYGDLECYGCDDEVVDERQAWRLGDFVNEFLLKMFQKCKSRVLALNIANTRSHPHLVEETMALAEQTGWQLRETLGITLSNRPTKQNIMRAEPILFFNKKFI